MARYLLTISNPYCPLPGEFEVEAAGRKEAIQKFKKGEFYSRALRVVGVRKIGDDQKDQTA